MKTFPTSKCQPTLFKGRLASRNSLARVVRTNAGARNGNGSGFTQPANNWRELNDPAHIWARGYRAVEVQDYPGEGALNKYMRLPVEQYCVLDPKLITSLEGDRFELKVPRVDIMDVWLEPLAVVKVTQTETPARVTLTTETCQIRGSDLVQSLNLDRRFCMQFKADLQWQNGASTTSQNGSGRPSKGRIIVNSKIDVWCEIQPPFNLMPREILEGSCNVALDTLMKTLLPVFVGKLSDDYAKWSTNESYRVERSQWGMVSSGAAP